MRNTQYQSCRVTIGTGRYATTPIGNVPLLYLFVLRRWGTAHIIFGDEAQRASYEIALRRVSMNISTRTIRAIEILGLMIEQTQSGMAGRGLCSAEVVHQILYKRYTTIPPIARTKAILDTMCRAGHLVAVRGRHGGYYLKGAVNTISLYSLDKLFRKEQVPKSRVGYAIHTKMNDMCRQWTIGDILTDEYPHQH